MDELRDDLKLCNTLNEVFDVLDKYYDLDQKMGLISRSILLSNVRKIILMTGAKKRKCQEEQQ